MIMRRLILAAAMSAGFAGAAIAQTPTTETSGSVRDKLVRNSTAWCSVTIGPSSFQRPSSSKAYFSFGEVNLTFPQSSSLPVYYLLSGQAVLQFSTPSSGTISFLSRTGYPTDVLSPSFSGYVETYNPSGKSLAVRYNILFPGCTLPVSGNYRY